jgi:PKD repeat protein
VSGQASHRYAYPTDGQAYDGRVRVADAAGLVTEVSFTANIEDHPTTISDLTLTVLRNGKVFTTVAAEDPDAEALSYSFDMEGDGLSDSGSRLVSEFVYEYRRGGTYEVVIAVTDPWSGTVTAIEREFVLEPWVSSAPVAEDHLEGEEGRCLVLRLADGRVTSETGQEICDREENPNAELWRWDFGDGTIARGSEVGHVYPNDGIFLVTVEGGDESQPIASTIEVLVVNVAPAFVTQPPEFAQGGETYFYTVEISDQGPDDEIQLELASGVEGMFLEPLGNRQWQLSWDVPQEMDGMFEIELVAKDGKTVDGVWEPDGGETVQRYRLTVNPTPIPDAAPPEPDAFLPSFENITGDQIGCAATDFDGSPIPLLGLLLMLGLVARRERG